MAANPKLGVPFPVWKPGSAIGDNIGPVGTELAVCASNPEIGRAVSRLETTIANWGQHWSGVFPRDGTRVKASAGRYVSSRGTAVTAFGTG